MAQESGMAAKRTWLEKEVAFFCAFDRDFEPFAVPPEIAVLKGQTKGGLPYLRLSNGGADAYSFGNTGGYSIRLPDAVEAQASGRHIVVKIVARAANADKARFALAYSTNEVGNSGWVWFDATAQWAIHTMRWDVPTMRDGNGDFLGVLPDVEGKAGAEFCYLAIAVI
ncbi:hypothetical protein ACNHKD_15100 [Methylocystis sp. JAN1]|uniref:hypothetical protein n=1 Tax=Methylocystis sp. JAN1 TaxID=3397211 RepID=UPI003FA23A38